MTGWYQRLNSRGRVVSGAGQLFLDEQPLYGVGHHAYDGDMDVDEPCSRCAQLPDAPIHDAEVGWNPVWFTDDSFIYNAAERGLRIYDVHTRTSVQLDPRELIELSAGGGLWAGRHAPTKRLIVSDGREIEGAGQPCIASDGSLVYRVVDDKIEPSICLTASAWGDGRGHLIAWSDHAPARDVTVGDFEARAILIDTPEGPWVLCMTRAGFHLRPLFADAGIFTPVGYAIETGEDRNLNAHAVCLGNVIRCVWQDVHGNPFARDIDLGSPRVSLPVNEAAPDPEPEADPPSEEPPVSVPNYLDLVRELWASLDMDRLQRAAFDRAGKDGIQQLQIHFTRRVILALRAKGERAFHECYGNPIPGTSIQLEPAVVLLDGYGPTQSCKVIGGNADDNWTFGHPQWFVADVLPKPADRREPDSDIGPSPFTGGDAGDPGDEDDGQPDPAPGPDPQPVCQCAAELAVLKQRQAEFNAVLTAFMDAQSETNKRLDTRITTFYEKPLPELVARGRVSIPWLGSKAIELPVEKK